MLERNAMSTTGKLFGVSVGPGDPELLTIKAAKAIEAADCIAIPDKGNGRRTALTIIESYIDGKKIIDCETPMNPDRSVVLAAYERVADQLCEILAEGKSIAYAVLGDATVYSTYCYIQDMVIERGFEAEIIPGVTSFCASAAKLGIALCEGPEQLLVMPAGSGNIESAIDYPANKIIMKSGKSLPAVKAMLEEKGLIENSAAVMNCGLEDEAIFDNLADMPDRDDYFCVVIAKEDAANN